MDGDGRLWGPACGLKRLILVSCSLVAQDLREIGVGVLKNETLIAVDLSYNNNLGDEGCREAGRRGGAGGGGRRGVVLSHAPCLS